MAKLKARGREEIFRVSKTVPGNREGVAEVTHYLALASDGSVLERMVLRYTAAEKEKNYGKGSHDYGWKVRGRAKAGRSVEQLLKPYLDAGWHLVEASPSYFRISRDSVEGLSSEPLIEEAAAARRAERLKKSREKSATERTERARTHDGPGFYVTNGYTGGRSIFKTRVADHERPFQDVEAAIKFAVQRLRHLTVDYNFNYLLPVLLVEASSRREAEEGGGRLLWTSNDPKSAASASQEPGYYIVEDDELVDDDRPYATVDAAVEDASAVDALASQNKISVKRPLKVVEASSSRAAARGEGHVWWLDGKFKGPPVDPKQTGFGF
jgi:hypothetical protein